MDVADLKCDIIGLSMYTEYSVWVVAVNEFGAGSATEEKLVRTYSDIPSDTPRNISVEPGSTVSILGFNVCWLCLSRRNSIDCFKGKKIFKLRTIIISE